MSGPRVERLDVRGVGVRLFTAGEGPAVLVLHGAGGCRWEPWMSRLSQEFHVLLPEHPWFGLSDAAEAVTTVPDLAFHYLELLECLGIQRPHLVGFSLGGWVAAELAAWQAERLRTLCLVDAAGLYADGPRLDVFQMEPEDLPAALYVHPERAVPPVGAPEEQVRIAVRNRVGAARFGWERWDDPKLAPRLHRVGVPALVVWGARDPVFPVAQGEAFRDSLPAGRLLVIPDAGHNPAVDQQERFLDALLGFYRAAAPEVRP